MFLCYVTIVGSVLSLGSQTEPVLPRAPGLLPGVARRVGLFVFSRTMSDMDDELTPERNKGLPVVPPGLPSRQHKLSLTFFTLWHTLSLPLSPSVSLIPLSVSFSLFPLSTWWFPNHLNLGTPRSRFFFQLPIVYEPYRPIHGRYRSFFVFVIAAGTAVLYRRSVWLLCSVQGPTPRGGVT